ncbi:phosphatidylinositol 4-kinase gamma 7-like [Bidens hawaiensis]|uniref:phosphatidylinositol 4-kinase gamma 7-like n=1 Tax=Bidens hawaiensis TaxID=980011 RepID=UPI00404AB249
MSSNLDSPVQTQMAVSVLKTPMGREYHGNDRKPTGSRRVFVQLENGCVLGMDLDRNDNAHMVKRRLQIALNVPIEESLLTFGDMVLKNDLSAIRPDSPLLLTRSIMHRSSSTPCLSPSGRDVQNRDQSGPIEILCQSGNFSRTKELVNEVVAAIKTGVDPVRVNGGLGGAYYFRNSDGESVAIVKPTDEEPFAPNNPKGFVGKTLGQPGLKRSVRVGETGYREVAAYLLDYDHFANVPPTALVKITHSIFNVNNIKQNRKKKHVCKIASFQQFIPHDFDASDHGTSSFPVSAVHHIGILDIRILNTDRHAGNLLVRKVNDDGKFGQQVELIPIDHGLCLPESLEDPYFEWIHWPQASIPFSDDELDYINALDPYRDADMLRTELPMIREACLRVLTLCTVFLKEATSYGLCLAEIGEMMTREFRRGEEEPSELEVLCMEARKVVAEREMFVLSPKTAAHEDGFLFEIDCDESEVPVNPILPFQFGPGRNPLSKLEEEDEHDEHEDDTFPIISEKLPSLKKNLSLGDSSAGHRSASEQLPASASFVKVADMTDDEWGLFLDTFVGLLHRALVERKGVVVQRQRQRLGTSCRF